VKLPIVTIVLFLVSLAVGIYVMFFLAIYFYCCDSIHNWKVIYKQVDALLMFSVYLIYIEIKLEEHNNGSCKYE